MAAPDCRMLVWSEPPRAIVRILGRATAPAAPDFVALIDQLRAQGHNCFAFELSECVLIDSTFVGQMAQLALLQHQAVTTGAGHRVMLVNPGPHIIDLLDTIFVLDQFEIVHDADAVKERADAIEKDCTTRTREEVNRCCLEAHRLLVALAPENAAKFQDVIRYLEQSTGTKA